MDTESRIKEPSVTRRNILRKGAAGALGAAAASAITATRASAADGDPIILGQENFASSPTVIKQTQPGDTSSLAFGGGFLSAVSAEGPVVFGTLDLGGGSLRVATDFISPAISASTPLSGPAISADAQGTGIIASGIHGPGVIGESADAAGVHGRSDHGTGVVAEAGPHVQFEGTAFEAVGPVKFSTSGLADVAASTDRVIVDPGVPITAQSKVLAMLQGNSGNKSMVEHVEVNPAGGTFLIVLTKPPTRSVQVAWFLIS
jgi:hypothetical protein